MTEYTGGSVQADHLCVLVHGLWGNPDHMATVAETLRSRHPEDKLYLLVAKSNSGTFTYDGIETGGERVCTEIEDVLDDIAARGGRIARLSVIGYSLGGLVARYAIGLLHAKGRLDTLECMNFTAFASPFLGVRSPRRGMANTVWNALGGRILSMSGRQLFGIDAFRDTGRPLLAVLADPDSIFMAALARFRRRTLYANIVHDLTAVHYTTAITKTDPYASVRADHRDMSDLPLRFVPGYDDVILDREQPIAWRRPEGTTSTDADPNTLPRKPSQGKVLLQALLTSPWSKEARATLVGIAPYVVIVLLLPLGATAFLVHSAYETVRSRRRRRLHEGGLAGIDVSQYRVSVWMKNLQATADETFESLDNAHEPDHLAYHEDEQDGQDADDATADGRDEAAELDAQLAYDSEGQLSGATTVSTATTPDTTQKQPQKTQKHLPVTDADAQPELELPQYRQTLALSSDQFAMIESLDKLGWRKYPVWIRKVRHSHAAIIRRRKEPAYDEGLIVLRHFVEEEFLV